MTNLNGDQELTAAVHGLSDELAGLREETGKLAAYGTQNRRLIKLVAASVAFDVLLSVGLGFAVYRAQEASDRAEQAASAAVVTCRSGNEARALQTNLWNFILSFPPRPDETAEDRTRREETVGQFRVYIKDAFAPRDCDQLLKGVR